MLKITEFHKDSNSGVKNFAPKCLEHLAEFNENNSLLTDFLSK